MRNRYLISALLILFGVAGCSSDGGDGGGPTAAELVTKGWQDYSAKNYNTALSEFNQAITLDGSLTDAYNGAGWSYAILGRADSALLRFTAGRNHDSTKLDMRAGIALVYNALKSYDLSIAQDTVVIRANPNWSFIHDATMNVLDLHLLAAEDYFAQGNYTASLAEVLILNHSFGNPDVSTIGGQIILAKEIERLRTLI
jgi:tetratricopeptide (TPR) repeat protein